MTDDPHTQEAFSLSRCFECRHVLKVGSGLSCTGFCTPADGLPNRRGTKGIVRVSIIRAMERCGGRFYRPAVQDPKMPTAGEMMGKP